MSNSVYRPYLSHSGILGMKWGRRRFQNEDGSLTPEGRIRYGRYSELDPKERGEATLRMKGQGDVLSGARQVADSASQIAGRHTTRSVKDSPARSMTDEELRSAVNRLNMERQYNQLTGRDVNRGAEAVRSVLADTAMVVGIVGGIVTIRNGLRKTT